VTPDKYPSIAVVRDFPHDRRSDADLVRDVVLGHEGALAAVWRRHGPAVRRTLFAQLGRDDSVDDLLQEVFLAFSHGAGRITQPDRLRSYLMAAAVRQARQAIRDRSRRRRWLGLLAEDRKGASMPPAVHGRDALRRLRDILDLMPDRLRESFILRFVEGLPTVEIAEIRDVSLATAKRDVAKAHDRVLFQARRDPILMDYLRGVDPATAQTEAEREEDVQEIEPEEVHASDAFATGEHGAHSHDAGAHDPASYDDVWASNPSEPPPPQRSRGQS
jgi:RNA polymerase sigma factor (sigma-70 family)